MQFDYAYYKAYIIRRCMKYRDLVRILLQNGYSLDRSSGRHEIYVKENCSPIAVPHHREINENTAKSILQKIREC